MGARRVVIAVSQRLEDFGGELQPRSVKRGDVAPVSAAHGEESMRMPGLEGGREGGESSTCCGR
jgi:hypothetical protein